MNPETEKELEEKALDRVTRELREARAELRKVKLALSEYGDMGLMTTNGAIQNCIKHIQAVADVKKLLERSSRNPEAAMKVLMAVEKRINEL